MRSVSLDVAIVSIQGSLLFPESQRSDGTNQLQPHRAAGRLLNPVQTPYAAQTCFEIMRDIIILDAGDNQHPGNWDKRCTQLPVVQPSPTQLDTSIPCQNLPDSQTSTGKTFVKYIQNKPIR